VRGGSLPPACPLAPWPQGLGKGRRDGVGDELGSPRSHSSHGTVRGGEGRRARRCPVTVCDPRVAGPCPLAIARSTEQAGRKSDKGSGAVATEGRRDRLPVSTPCARAQHRAWCCSMAAPRDRGALVGCACVGACSRALGWKMGRLGKGNCLASRERAGERRWCQHGYACVRGCSIGRCMAAASDRGALVGCLCTGACLRGLAKRKWQCGRVTATPTTTTGPAHVYPCPRVRERVRHGKSMPIEQSPPRVPGVCSWVAIEPSRAQRPSDRCRSRPQLISNCASRLH
jgi:hypothetical protein